MRLVDLLFWVFNGIKSNAKVPQWPEMFGEMHKLQKEPARHLIKLDPGGNEGCNEMISRIFKKIQPKI